MAFNTAEGRAEYSATSGQTLFTFNFKIYRTSDIEVYLTPAGTTPDDTKDILTETTHYTVSIDGDNGGSVTLVTPATLNDAVTFVRKLPNTRDTEYQALGDLYADTLNMDQNYQTYLLKDRETTANRHVSIPKSAQGVSVELPDVAPLNFFQWNADGTAIQNVSSLQADGFIWTAAEVYNKTEVDTLIDINSYTEKTTPVDADELALADSAATFSLKKLTWANLKVTLKTYLDTLYRPIAYTEPFLHIQDQKTTGTNGGSSIAGTQTRVLNTVLTNTITGASLSTNQVTLPAGDYYIEASSITAGAVNRTRSLIANITDASEPIIGMSYDYGAGGESFLRGILSINAEKVIELQQYTTSAVATVGLGASVSDGRTEVYADLRIWKV